jgi:hypothetical protein
MSGEVKNWWNDFKDLESDIEEMHFLKSNSTKNKK